MLRKFSFSLQICASEREAKKMTMKRFYGPFKLAAAALEPPRHSLFTSSSPTTFTRPDYITIALMPFFLIKSCLCSQCENYFVESFSNSHHQLPVCAYEQAIVGQKSMRKLALDDRHYFELYNDLCNYCSQVTQHRVNIRGA